jgi:DNA-binding MarR family transcriptional regulator
VEGDSGVGSRLKDEIKQTKPFSSLQEEALLNIRRTSGFLEHSTHQMFKGHDLTESQYNVLRILRGAGAGGLRCSEIGERMISRDPDITRLLKRLELRGLVERRPDTCDRRVIHIRISEAGSRVLKQLDPVVETATSELVAHMNKERLGLLIDLMEEVRLGMVSVQA